MVVDGKLFNPLKWHQLITVLLLSIASWLIYQQAYSSSRVEILTSTVIVVFNCYCRACYNHTLEKIKEARNGIARRISPDMPMSVISSHHTSVVAAEFAIISVTCLPIGTQLKLLFDSLSHPFPVLLFHFLCLSDLLARLRALSIASADNIAHHSIQLNAPLALGG